jgi:hypothetical protein
MPILSIMFKYFAHDPESAFSVIAAAFRLYFDSFLYTLVLAIIATLTFFSMYFLTVTYLPQNNNVVLTLLSFVPTLISLIFFIPLIKRIYSVGSELPITTAQAFSGFFVHYFRMAFFAILCIAAATALPALWLLINPQLPPGIHGYGFGIYLAVCAVLFVYIFVGLKLYFTAMFIILENKPVFESIKLSYKLSHDHLWLTFWVLVVYAFGYWGVSSIFGNIIVWEVLGVDLIKEAFTVITLPLFLSIQITQFFNLKKLAQQSTTQPS